MPTEKVSCDVRNNNFVGRVRVRVGVKVRLMVRVWGYGVRLGCEVRLWG